MAALLGGVAHQWGRWLSGGTWASARGGAADQAASQAIQDWLAVNRDAQTPHVLSAGLREDLGRVEIGVEPDITDAELDAVAQAFDPRTICITPGEAPGQFNATTGDGS